jgi:hypothetical protein
MGLYPCYLIQEWKETGTRVATIFEGGRDAERKLLTCISGWLPAAAMQCNGRFIPPQGRVLAYSEGGGVKPPLRPIGVRPSAVLPLQGSGLGFGGCGPRPLAHH